MKKFITIYVTHKNKQEAEKIISYLLTNKLIACVNYFWIDVAYHWKWEIQNDNEIVSLLKTRSENWEEVKKYIEKNHSYEIPCIIKTDVEANKEYVEWIYEVTE
jgi:periplasmic divalent cation tolerance protein